MLLQLTLCRRTDECLAHYVSALITVGMLRSALFEGETVSAVCSPVNLHRYVPDQLTLASECALMQIYTNNIVNPFANLPAVKLQQCI